MLIGVNAGRDLDASEGNDLNVMIGYQSGFTGGGAVLTDGSNLTLIGNNTEAANTLTNATAIGANAVVKADNSLVLGSINGENGATASTNVGIGTTTPDNRLEIVKGAQGSNISGLRLWSLVGSTPTASTGEVLSIDANGDVIVVEDTSNRLALLEKRVQRLEALLAAADIDTQKL